MTEQKPADAISASEQSLGIPSGESLDFTNLVAAIRQTHERTAAAVNRTVNTMLTLRNWMIGGYIRAYEQNGADRAQYGTRLLDTLAIALQEGLDRCYTGRYLGLCRQLFDVYPEIRKSLISEFANLPLPLAVSDPQATEIPKSVISGFRMAPRMLIERLSFTHLVELIALDDPSSAPFTRSSASEATGRCGRSGGRSTRSISSVPGCPPTRTSSPP